MKEVKWTGERMRRLRAMRGFSQLQLGLTLGLATTAAQSQISLWECRGWVPAAHTAVLEAIEQDGIDEAMMARIRNMTSYTPGVTNTLLAPLRQALGLDIAGMVALYGHKPNWSGTYAKYEGGTLALPPSVGIATATIIGWAMATYPQGAKPGAFDPAVVHTLLRTAPEGYVDYLDRFMPALSDSPAPVAAPEAVTMVYPAGEGDTDGQAEYTDVPVEPPMSHATPPVPAPVAPAPVPPVAPPAPVVAPPPPPIPAPRVMTALEAWRETVTVAEAGAYLALPGVYEWASNPAVIAAQISEHFQQCKAAGRF